MHLIGARIVLSDTPWTERDAAAVVKCVLEALAALHEARVVHLNVTTENIVFDAPSGGVVVEGLTLSRMAPTDAPITTAIAGGTLQVCFLFFQFCARARGGLCLTCGAVSSARDCLQQRCVVLCARARRAA